MLFPQERKEKKKNHHGFVSTLFLSISSTPDSDNGLFFWKSSHISVLTNLQFPILLILSLDFLGNQFLCIFLSQSALYNLILSPSFQKSGWKSVSSPLVDRHKFYMSYINFMIHLIHVVFLCLDSGRFCRIQNKTPSDRETALNKTLNHCFLTLTFLNSSHSFWLPQEENLRAILEKRFFFFL